MKRYVGTMSFGVRTPIIQVGDNLVQMVADSVVSALYSKNLNMQDRDIVCVTESLLARAQGNYVTTQEIAEDVSHKFPSEFGVVFPILSRNRFAPILEGLAKTGRKLHLLLAYPSDEVGNRLMDEKLLYGSGINPYSDILDEASYRAEFGEEVRHTFTGVDYVNLYKEIAPNCEIHFANDSRAILEFTKDVLVCSVHSRRNVKQELIDAGAHIVYGLDDILTESNGSGFNPDYGLLGSNAAGEGKLKLFPRDSQHFVDALAEKLSQMSGKQIEVMVYGDGAFKDPVGQIWELADPVVSPAHTEGLSGTPNEIKMKYIADTEFAGLSQEEMEAKMTQRIHEKDATRIASVDETLGTTPRRITDLLGSLADLTSGSGDKGTPVVYVQGYFDNFASE